MTTPSPTSGDLSSIDPTTGESVGSVPLTHPSEVAGVIERSRKAFTEWSALSHAERRAHLRRFKQALLAEGVRAAEVIRSETGKPLEVAYSTDVLTSLSVLDFYLRNAEKILRPKRGGSWPYLSTKGWTEYHPRGVAGIISPNNYPFFLAMIPAATALAAGCAVVIKPSELTPLTGELFVDIARKAGLPTDLVQVIQGGADVGEALIDAPIDVLAFTGSTRVGKVVAARAAQRLIPVVLELGGNDAMVVLDDADIDQAAQAAVWGGMLNAGQACTSVERLYVVDEIYDQFMAQLDKAFDNVTIGSDGRRGIGPFIHAGQSDVVQAHVDDAIAKGARVLRGGRRTVIGDGLYYEPTLIVDVDHSMLLTQDETFGPVLPVMRVRDEAEALQLANDSRFGLHGSVWTKDRARGAEFASKMETGTVAVNDVAVNFIIPTVAFGGIRDSGYGANFGEDGIRTTYCFPKSITSARLPMATTKLLGAWQPRRGLAYWKVIARALFRW